MMTGRRRIVAFVGVLAAVASLVACENISYTDPPFQEAQEGVARRLDIHRPPDAPDDAPVIVYVPGGGWVGANENDVALPGGLDHYLDEGFVVVSISYRSTWPTLDGIQWPLNAYDVARAVRWVRAYHENLSIDPDRVIVAGHSAGAHLAASVTTGAFDDEPGLPDNLESVSSRPDGLVLLAGPYDLSAEALAPIDVFDADAVELLLGCDHRQQPLPAGCEAQVQSASPASSAHQGELSNFPPTFITFALDDDVIRPPENTEPPPPPQSTAFAFQLCATQTVEVHYEEVEQGGHNLSGYDPALVDQFLSQWHSPAAPTPPRPPEATCNTASATNAPTSTPSNGSSPGPGGFARRRSSS